MTANRPGGSGRTGASGLSVARYGFSDVERAAHQLNTVGLWGGDGPTAESSSVLTALSRAADPDLALHGLVRLRETLGTSWQVLRTALISDVGLRGRLLAVLGTSTALIDHLVAHPEQWARLKTGSTANHGENELTELLLGAVGAGRREGGLGVAPALKSGDKALSALRTAYRSALLDIAAADLASEVEPSLEQPCYEAVVEWLSHLAVGAVRASLAVAMTEQGATEDTHAPRLAVIAMGKCGAYELNYVSDVDVVFVCALEDEVPKANRLASTMMRIAGSACFQVDAGLRPEGKSGTLVRTLDGHISYYRRWARTWEFQALLKARPIAGDEHLGQQYLDAVGPFVWTAAERDGFVADVQSMRKRVEDHVSAQHAERELKLGRGGLRDVEFAVQLLQMVHGRSDASLQVATTLDALRGLGEGGYVGRADAADLCTSYRFLRILEHRLQLRRLRRTHLFPAFDDTNTLHWLGRSAGVRPDGRRTVGEVVLAEFRLHSNKIRRLHEKLFYRPLLESVAKVPTEALRLTTKAASERLNALGYTSAEGALRHIQALTSGMSRRASIQGALLPVLLDLFAEAPDPDAGLLAYRKVSEALAETPWYLRLLRDEGAVAERLAKLLGTSKLVPELLVRAPEVLRLLADTGALVQRDPAQIENSLRSAVGRHSDPDRAVATARSLRRHELLRVACADLLGFVSPESVWQSLSRVWLAVLRAALDVSIRDVSSRSRSARGATGSSVPTPARIAVIGMGRLGGLELGYGSDADVLFVCEPTEDSNDDDAVRFATAVAERVRGLLGAPSQDPALEVDANLRPEGRSGPLVRTLGSYLVYYRKWASAWEAQALLRAVAVAGDEDLGARFCAGIADIRYPNGGLDSAGVREIRRIKARVDAERLPRGADPATHTKLGRGGLADVEWTLQLLQLRYAHEFAELQTTSTVDGLRAAAQVGVLSDSDATELIDAWTFAMRARNAIMLVRGKPSDQIPRRSRELVAIASALGYRTDGDPGVFVDEYRRATRRAHAVVQRVFFE